jgi:hypothetical protein
VIGRRLPDTRRSFLPDDIQRGDYWKVLTEDDKPVCLENESENLTKTEWMVVAPLGETAYGIGRLTKHTVREHEDGTISVRPGDGSSNSILITGARGLQYHGYIEKGVWVSV